MELEQTYIFRTDTGTQNENRALTLSALQRIIVVISEEHLENIGLDVPHLMREYGVSWVLLSISVDIKSPIRDGERLSVRTWHTEKKGVYFRREVEICHPDGSVAAVAATFSSIFDMKTRRLSTDPEVLEKVDQLGNGKELLEAESRIRIKPDDFPVVMTQKVMPSWIDSLGHVNNFRYGDLITDALPEEVRAKLGNLSRYEIGFTGELRLGESVELRLKEEDGTVFVAGIRSSDEKPAFLAKLSF
jgi:acyl-CoA thioesterase FadM